jgi:hypothetical protein
MCGQDYSWQPFLVTCAGALEYGPQGQRAAFVFGKEGVGAGHALSYLEYQFNEEKRGAGQGVGGVCEYV